MEQLIKRDKSMIKTPVESQGSKEPPFLSHAPAFIGCIAILFLCLFRLRIALWFIESIDTTVAFVPWVTYIQTHGHLHALKSPIGDYFASYYSVLALASYLSPWLSPLSEVKLIPLVFDLVIAFMAYKIVQLLESEYAGPKPFGWAWFKPLLAAIIIFALPSLMVDGAAWGQCDSLYISFLLISVYFLMRHAPIPASLFFGLSLAFKLQAIFLGPFLLVALLRGRFRWWHVVFVPIGSFLTFLPSMFMGRSLGSLLLAYKNQPQSTKDFATNVANFWSLYLRFHLPTSDGFNSTAALLLTIAVAVLVVYIGYTQKVLSTPWLFFFATYTLAIMPYVMPKMHDRYFLSAQVFLVILACHRLRFALAAALMEVSLLLVSVRYFGVTDGRAYLILAILANSAGIGLLCLELWSSRKLSQAQVPAAA
jgi:Gpi18-like mannosyltransferase